MNRFGVSVGVSPREPLRAVGEIARSAETAGFEALWIIDFQLGMKDAYAAMLCAALESETISIGPGVTNLVTRHPTVTANAVAALDELSEGRALIGLGAGASAVYGVGLPHSTTHEIVDGIRQLRGLLGGERVAVNGTEVRLAAAQRQVPIYVAAAQPKMLRLSAELADGIVLMGAADRNFCEWQLGYIYEGLERAGRSREDVTIDLLITMSARMNRSDALDDVRAWATSQAWGFSKWQIIPAEFERFRPDFESAAAAYRIIDHLSLRADHKFAVSDEFVSTVAIAGNQHECVERLAPLAALDVDRITFALLSGGRIHRLEQLASEILPRLA